MLAAPGVPIGLVCPAPPGTTTSNGIAIVPGQIVVDFTTVMVNLLTATPDTTPEAEIVVKKPRDETLPGAFGVLTIAPSAMRDPVPTLDVHEPPPTTVSAKPVPPLASAPLTASEINDASATPPPTQASNAEPDSETMQTSDTSGPQPFGQLVSAQAASARDVGGLKIGQSDVLQNPGHARLANTARPGNPDHDLPVATPLEPARAPHVVETVIIDAAPVPQPDDDGDAGEIDSVEATAEPVRDLRAAEHAPAPKIEHPRPTAPFAEHVHEQVTEHLSHLRENGHAELHMNLHPPELGRVQLHLDLDSGRLNVRFLVQNDGAKLALDQQVETLRVRFAEMGLSLGQFDVRRDGTAANWQPPPESAGDGMTAPRVGHSTRKPYSPLTDADALVDVFA
jgi:flagellar hook-length control protein FliK